MVAAMAERAMAEDRREKVLANVRAVRERAEAQGDPLGIRRRPAATETRKASGQAAASVRKVRDPLLRSSGSVRRLMTHGVIGRREFLAADRLAELWHCAVGGALVRALDWTLERVDGGRGLIEPEMLIGAGAAERELWLVRCHAAGCAELVGSSAERIRERVTALLTNTDRYRAMAKAQNPYGDGRASGRIRDTLLQRSAAKA
jgi:hypothetical protein